MRDPVAGLVNMNMIMIDVTDIPGVRKGDEVVIIGKQGDNTISVGSFGELTRFINYELLVGGTTTIALELSGLSLPFGLNANVFGIGISAVVYFFVTVIHHRNPAT